MSPGETPVENGRSVLFLAYYFPPLGGGGVQRSINFVRYLPQHGYRPIVVTRPAAAPVQWGPRDVSLTARIPPETEVHRLADAEPARTVGWRCRAERWLRVEEPFSRWWVTGAVAAGRALVDDTALVYASMSPFETGRAAARLAAESGKPWVADLRDPWALDDWLVFPTGLHRSLELRTMRRTLASAAAIVMNTPESARELLRCAPELRDRRVVTIPNGFDANDFAGPAPLRNDGAFRIVHAGHVHTTRGSASARLGRRLLRGAASGFESATRSHLVLLDGLERLFAKRPELRGTIELHLAGAVSEGDRAALPDFVRAYGYLTHGETIDLLRSADLLFLPMHDLAPGVRARIVPGKTYEYLASGTPILGAVPEGDARDLLVRAGNARVVQPGDAAGMAEAVAGEVDRFQRGDRGREPDPDLLAGFERRRLTANLAEVFDGVLGARPTAVNRPAAVA